jgi:hypothetical protein
MKPLALVIPLVTLAALWPSSARAQMLIEKIDDPPRVAGYLEFGGNTAAVSLNLDVLVAPHTSIRAGGFAFVFDSDYWNGLIMVNQLFGRGGDYLEVGAGFVTRGGTDLRTGAGPTLSAGYRRQSRRSFFRVGVASTASSAGGRGWHPVLAISGGGTF